MNTRLWMTDSKAKLWRQSAGLPYGAGQTVYGATMVEKDGRAFIMGGFKDKVGLKLLCRKILSIAILMKVTVRLTYIHLQNNSSVRLLFICKTVVLNRNLGLGGS